LVEHVSGIKGRRWYSVQFGTKLYGIALDSNDSLCQAVSSTRWLKARLLHCPRNFRIVFDHMHHEPVADIQWVQTTIPTNEMAVVDLLEEGELKSKSKIHSGCVITTTTSGLSKVALYLSICAGSPQQDQSSVPNRPYQDHSFPTPLLKVRTRRRHA